MLSSPVSNKAPHSNSSVNSSSSPVFASLKDLNYEKSFNSIGHLEWVFDGHFLRWALNRPNIFNHLLCLRLNHIVHLEPPLIDTTIFETLSKIIQIEYQWKHVSHPKLSPFEHSLQSGDTPPSSGTKMSSFLSVVEHQFHSNASSIKSLAIN